MRTPKEKGGNPISVDYAHIFGPIIVIDCKEKSSKRGTYQT